MPAMRMASRHACRALSEKYKGMASTTSRTSICVQALQVATTEVRSMARHTLAEKHLFSPQ